MQTLDSNTMIHASSDCVVREISGEMVLLNLRNGTYYGLDAIGTRIWSLVAEGATFGAIVEDIHDATGAPAARIATDLNGFIADLDRHDLVAIGGSGTGGA